MLVLKFAPCSEPDRSLFATQLHRLDRRILGLSRSPRRAMNQVSERHYRSLQPSGHHHHSSAYSSAKRPVPIVARFAHVKQACSLLGDMSPASTTTHVTVMTYARRPLTPDSANALTAKTSTHRIPAPSATGIEDQTLRCTPRLRQPTGVYKTSRYADRVLTLAEARYSKPAPKRNLKRLCITPRLTPIVQRNQCEL